MIKFSDVNYEDTISGFLIKLGERAMKTPAGNEMIAKSEKLAEAIVKEWHQLEKTIDWKKLPLSNHLNAVIDNTESLVKWREDTAAFAKNDLVCYFASTPKELKDVQEAKWLPLVERINKELGIALKTTNGIVPINQDNDTLNKVAANVEKLNLNDIFIMRSFAGFLGSFVLAYGIFNNWISDDEAFSLSVIDEEWQEAHWGQDKEAYDNRQKILKEFKDVYSYYKLTR